ncbi:MAG: 6-carboxytetrahydropterin synthase [Actinomycetota bacterium]|nr:6-carboxytetrahydropterin synthase [Actinomycetota bacterium]
MYTVTVRDHVMVAHSLPRAVFGPAQALHGATYVVEATFARRELDDDGIVIDIGTARSALHEILDGLRYRNLDEHPTFEGTVTSTEVLARWVADRLADSPVTEGLDRLEVVLRESPDAWASYVRER